MNVLQRCRRGVVEYLPDLRDVHVYGGGVLMAWGAWSIDPAAGKILLGIVLLFLGLRRR